MQKSRFPANPEIIKPALRALRGKLISCKYNEKSMHSIGLNPLAITPDYLPLLEYKVKDRTPLNTLISLFILGEAVDYKSARRVFDSKGLANLVAIGLLDSKIHKDKVISAVKISPYRGFYFISDFIIRGVVKGRRRNKKRYDYVYPPGGDSVDLAEARIKGQIDSALDLCTGCGIQAILASRSSRRVIGVDINSRAVKFANMNLMLNNITNVEFRSGDLYDPVGPERFDYIIANPPFVISKEDEALYRDGGKRGNVVFDRLLFGLPKHLKEGGYCQIVTFLGEFSGLSQTKIFKQWVHKNKYDVLLLVLSEHSTDMLARGQFINILADFGEYRRRLSEYRDYLRKIKLKRVDYCIITIRNSSHYRFKRYRLNNVLQLNFRPLDKISKHYAP